jgi:chromosome segregation protein
LRIKKLELFGFKSFKDRTVIQFDQGITGVVGPNGCGKSNIVDALLWSMGEMSAKHLRGASMEDVIFAGAEGYAPMGMAEVSLTLENDGGLFPAQYAKFSEVQVTRRLHRGGESEYLINKEPARLRDIQEIFMDTGAGAKGFSIIEQGAIGKIVTSKPEDRRVLIEEAAGITKFKVRKRESQRKLESTDQNLVRLQDIIGEQKRQIDSLERQAQRAERYRKIKTELQEKEIWLSSHSYLKLHEDARDADSVFTECRDMSAISDARVNELQTLVSARRLEIAEKENQVQTVQLDYQTAVRSVQETEFRIRELNFTIEQARKSKEMTGSMLAQYSLRKSNLDSEKERLEEKLLDIREDLLRIETEFQTQNADFSVTQARITTADTELTDKRRETNTLSVSLSHLENKEIGLSTRLDENEKRIETSRGIIAELLTKKTDFANRRNAVYQQLESERQMQLDVTRDVDTIQQNLSLVTDQLKKREIEHSDLKDDLNETASRLYGLENLQANFEGFEAGVRDVMLWQRQRVTQVTHADGSVSTEPQSPSFQPLAEFIEVPENYELAMEAALGQRLQTLLSPSSEEVVGAVEYLKGQNKGRSSFISSEWASTQNQNENHDSQIRNESGVINFLNDVLHMPDAIKNQVSHFFKNIVIVDSIRTAIRLKNEYNDRTYVTMDGDCLTSDGVLTGGSSEAAESGVLKRRREIKELSLKREELAGKVQLSQLTVKKLFEQKEGIERDFEIAKKSAIEKEILITELRKDLERAEIELNNAVIAYDRENNNLIKEEAVISEIRDQLDELRSEIENMRELKLNLETRVESLTQELSTCREGIETKAKLVSDLRVRLASLKQENESLEREKLFVTQGIQDVTIQLAQMSEETEKSDSTLSESQILIEEIQTDLQRQIHRSQELEKQVGLVRNEFETENASLRAQEKELSETMSSLNTQRSRMSEAQIKLEKSQMNERYLLDQMLERYQIDLATVAYNYKDVPGDADQYERDVEELKDKVKRIGEVNLSAINEYDEVIKRYAFLSQQYNDLIEAKEHLRKVIDRINRICTKRFKETFEQVNERFEKVFPVLFGGGEARLILVETPEKDDLGIDIVAKPPGKKLQSVSLLSGGEKALTAVSLIFSIFLVKPSPFCLLDEVDAPLDDANVFRFNDLVREMAKRSQIIVVTHNKHTMKVNKKLYGVTMQEKGVSKMVSVSLADAENIANAVV